MGPVADRSLLHLSDSLRKMLASSDFIVVRSFHPFWTPLNRGALTPSTWICPHVSSVRLLVTRVVPTHCTSALSQTSVTMLGERGAVTGDLPVSATNSLGCGVWLPNENVSGWIATTVHQPLISIAVACHNQWWRFRCRDWCQSASSSLDTDHTSEKDCLCLFRFQSNSDRLAPVIC